jgi:hypothetical protein
MKLRHVVKQLLDVFEAISNNQEPSIQTEGSESIKVIAYSSSLAYCTCLLPPAAGRGRTGAISFSASSAASTHAEYISTGSVRSRFNCRTMGRVSIVDSGRSHA